MIKIPEITSAELLNRLETALYSNEELEHSQHFQDIKNMEVNPDDIDIVTLGSNNEALASREPFVVNQAHSGSKDPRVHDSDLQGPNPAQTPTFAQSSVIWADDLECADEDLDRS